MNQPTSNHNYMKKWTSTTGTVFWFLRSLSWTNVSRCHHKSSKHFCNPWQLSWKIQNKTISMLVQTLHCRKFKIRFALLTWLFLWVKTPNKSQTSLLFKTVPPDLLLRSSPTFCGGHPEQCLRLYGPCPMPLSQVPLCHVEGQASCAAETHSSMPWTTFFGKPYCKVESQKEMRPVFVHQSRPPRVADTSVVFQGLLVLMRWQKFRQWLGSKTCAPTLLAAAGFDSCLASPIAPEGVLLVEVSQKNKSLAGCFPTQTASFLAVPYGFVLLITFGKLKISSLQINNFRESCTPTCAHVRQRRYSRQAQGCVFPVEVLSVVASYAQQCHWMCHLLLLGLDRHPCRHPFRQAKPSDTWRPSSGKSTKTLRTLPWHSKREICS